MRALPRFFLLLGIFFLTYSAFALISPAMSSNSDMNPSLLPNQICANDICEIPAGTSASSSSSHTQINTTDIKPEDMVTGNIDHQMRELLSSHSFFSPSTLTASISFWLIGLLLAFTPCVLPLLILISSFLGVNNQISHSRSVLLSLTYIFAMSLTFAMTGALAANFGIFLHPYFQNPWIIGIFSLVIAILALSLLDFYQIKLPERFRHFIVQHNKLQSNYHFLEVAIMGMLATLITSPCVAAPLVGVLSYIGHTGNITLGSLGLFSLGLGIGTPLIAAVSIRKEFLPKSIFWQYFIKNLIGLALLGMSIYVSSRIIPSSWNMLIWSVFIVFIANFMLSLTNEQMNRTFTLLWRTMSMIVMAFGLMIFVGYMTGSRSPLQPLSALKSDVTFHDKFYNITGLNSFDNAVSNASRQGKPVLVYFTSRWCESCIELEADVLNDEHIMKIMDDFILLKVELDTAASPSYEIAKKFSITGTPEIIFFTPKGELSNNRLIGNTSKSEFESMLLKVESER